MEVTTEEREDRKVERVWSRYWTWKWIADLIGCGEAAEAQLQGQFVRLETQRKMALVGISEEVVFTEENAKNAPRAEKEEVEKNLPVEVRMSKYTPASNACVVHAIAARFGFLEDNASNRLLVKEFTLKKMRDENFRNQHIFYNLQHILDAYFLGRDHLATTTMSSRLPGWLGRLLFGCEEQADDRI